MDFLVGPINPKDFILGLFSGIILICIGVITLLLAIEEGEDEI